MTISYRGRKAKGDRAEREVVSFLRDHLGDQVGRMRSTQEDLGDVAGLPELTVQVKSYADVMRAIREGLADAADQKQRSGASWAAAFVRRPGGRYFVCMEREDFVALYREAMLR